MEYNAEGAYTTPELYRRQKCRLSSLPALLPNVNYNRFLFFDYFGFPYVGVSIVLEGELSYKSDKGWNTG